MHKKLILLLTVILGADLFICGKGERSGSFEGPLPGPGKEGRKGDPDTIAPRWLRGITVKNETAQPVAVSLDGLAHLESIPAGAEKLIATSMPGPKSVTWKTGEWIYETEQFGKPVYMIIKKDNRYDMTSMDGYKDMGGWVAAAPVESLNLLPKVIRSRMFLE
jgi:hypothetical protein